MLDPSIPLSVKPPEIQNPLQTLGQIGQIQAQKQQGQERQLQIQQTQKAMADSAAMNDLYRQNFQGGTLDVNGFTQSMAQAGLGQHIPAVVKAHNEIQEQVAKTQKTRADAALAQVELMGSYAGQLKANPLPGVADMLLHNADQAGLDTTSVRQQYQSLGPNPSPQALTSFADQLMQGSEKMKTALAAQSSAASREKTAQTSSDRLQWEKDNPGWQTHNVIGPDGKPAVAAINPKTQETKIIPGITPIPAASVQIHNMGGGAGAAGGLTKEGIEYAGTQYRVTGTMPPLGMGSAGARASVVNEAARQAGALGQSPVSSIQKQAAFKADAGALTQMTKMKSAAESFETKATAQADIVEDLSGKVGRTASPMLNNWLLSGKMAVTGDSDTSRLYNAITTFSAEYAKIMEGSFGSAAASSDSARKASERLIQASMNPKTLSDVVALMKREMRLTGQGYDATIDHITSKMGGAPQTQTEDSSNTSGGNVLRQPIPGVPGGVALSVDGGKTWKRVK